jgi:transcriptional regulator with XRE-family HTH domain
MAYKSFLTKRQLAVLRLRQAGLTQEEIARRIKTTRANISLIEKRARENVERSKETIREWNSVISPVEFPSEGHGRDEHPGDRLRRGGQSFDTRQCDSIGRNHAHQEGERHRSQTASSTSRSRSTSPTRNVAVL